MNIKYVTLGCKVNQFETEAIREMMASLGHTENPREKADVLIVNSCTVTGEGDKKTLKLFERAKRENEGCITVLTGCFPQAFPEKAHIFGADIVTGTKNRKALPELIMKAAEEKGKITYIEEHKIGEEFEELSVSSFEGHSRAFMKIQDGCDRFCSYCIIPYARGHLRSRPLESIKAEAETLAKSGYKEIVLTGINLSFYGRENKMDIADAVLAVSECEGIERIRLGSLQPDLIDEKIIKKFKKTDKLCPQFHLSLQSGSDTVLKRMNRRYTTSLYKEVAENLRKAFPNASITTDIIVGFPGESEAEFSETERFVREIGFMKVHVFPYSKRSGTPAAEMEGQVPESIKNTRKKRLIAVAEEVREAEIKSEIGKTVKVLIETGKAFGKMVGYSENYTPVLISPEGRLIGEIVEVIIEGYKEGYALGKIKT